MQGNSPLLPKHWPDPTDLIPDPPSPHRPQMIVSHEPILNHTKIYRGDDPYFTERLQITLSLLTMRVRQAGRVT